MISNETVEDLDDIIEDLQGIQADIAASLGEVEVPDIEPPDPDPVEPPVGNWYQAPPMFVGDDPTTDKRAYKTKLISNPLVKVRTDVMDTVGGLFPKVTPAFSTSNYIAGNLMSDPIMPDGIGDHEHTWVGNRLHPQANLERIWEEPVDYEVGSGAAKKGWGFPTLLELNGAPWGETPGLWFPTMYMPDGTPVELFNDCAVYYTRRSWQQGLRLIAYPNGAAFVITQPENIEWKIVGGLWKLNFFGPTWFHPQIHIGRFPVAEREFNDKWVSYAKTRPGPEWFPAGQFQTYIKTRVPGEIDLPNLVRYGGPDPGITDCHLEYVAGYPGHVLQEIHDRVLNIPVPVKWHGSSFLLA